MADGAEAEPAAWRHSEDQSDSRGTWVVLLQQILLAEEEQGSCCSTDRRNRDSICNNEAVFISQTSMVDKYCYLFRLVGVNENGNV